MERKVHPKAWTYANIAAMKKQLQSIGLMFLDFLAAGLVERKQSKVNWDPIDMTVLANEPVIDGRGWRSSGWLTRRASPHQGTLRSMPASC
jgi:leucyl-tRNA synthetase